MPAPVTPWADFTPPTAKSMNVALYTTDGTSDNPNGIAAQVYRPILVESIRRAISFPSGAGGSVTSMSSVAGTAPTTNGIAIYDTAGYYGQSSDQPGGVTFYEYTSVISGSAGDGISAGGWIIFGQFAAMKTSSTQTNVGADLLRSGSSFMTGSHQLPSNSRDNCPFFLDLVNSGVFIWQPAAHVYDSAGAAVLNAVNITDSSGETCRLYVVWAAAASASSGEINFTVSGIFNWTAPLGVTSVTVQSFGAGGGGGAGNASSGGAEFSGGGAGGGECTVVTLSVTPGNNYPVIVGAAGQGGTNPGGNGADGGNSSFSGDAGNAVGHGGSGGAGATITASGAGGTGGTGAGGTHFPGGAGAAGQSGTHGGGGGSSAGISAAGNPGSGASGGVAPAGGGPGGLGGSVVVKVVQIAGISIIDSNNLTVNFPSAVQAGNAVIACIAAQGSHTSAEPVVKLNDGKVLNEDATADFTGTGTDAHATDLQTGVYSIFNVTGGQKGITVHTNGTFNRVISGQIYEVSGLGIAPTVEVSKSNTATVQQSTWQVTQNTASAPELWIGCVGAQNFLNPFDVSIDSGNGWNRSAGSNGLGINNVFLRLRSAFQVQPVTGQMKYSGSFSRDALFGVSVVAYTVVATTPGSAPVVGPGGGGGGALGLFDGAAGLDGKITLNWTGLTGSGYGAPPLPAPEPTWDANSTVSANLLNGNTGIKGVVDFLNSAPMLRVHTTTNQAIPNAANTTVAVQNDSGSVVQPPPPPPNTLTITTLSLQAGSVGVPYSATISATGGTAPYTWSVNVSPPPGLALNAITGVISGVPTTTVTDNFVVTVTDHGGLTATQALTITIVPGPVINTNFLPNGSVGIPYSTALSATGGTTPYTWSFSGTLPLGLLLNGTTGVISGTPAAVTATPVSITAIVTDSNNLTDTQVLTITVTSGPPPPPPGGVPAFDHIVVVVMENHGFNQIIGFSTAPYINSLAGRGALFTQCYSLQHPSSPAYLHMFSGSNQGVNPPPDLCPPTGAPFNAPNLASGLIAAGKTFGGYAMSIPANPLDCTSTIYDPNHVPWLRFSNLPGNPPGTGVNHNFTTFPTTSAGFAALPTVSMIIPDGNNSMESSSTLPAAITQGDNFLKNNIDAYATWATTHNSLLVVTWDEDQGFKNGNGGSPIGGGHVVTIFVGQGVVAGQYSGTINHYNVLRTIEDAYGLPHNGNAANATTILNCWSTSSVTPPTAVLALSPTSGTAPLPVTASGASSTPGTNPIANYAFDFGDGTLVTGVSPTASHTYLAAGNYNVLLTVKDTAALTGSTSKTVSVTTTGGGPIPAFDHIVMVLLENRGYTQIIGSQNATLPADRAVYINSLLSTSALFTNSHGVQHPSFPNYMALFSGGLQGATTDNCPPAGQPFAAANMRSSLVAAGKTFGGYAENMPASRTTCGPAPYAGRHVPYAWFSSVPVGEINDFSAFPTNAAGFAALPTMSFVVPNLNNDMHDGTIQQGDTWLQTHMDPYLQWAKTNNSLLIIQFDEDNFTPADRIPTIFCGQHVKAGQYAESGAVGGVSGQTGISHYNILRTIEDAYGAAHTGIAATATPITDCWI